MREQHLWGRQARLPAPAAWPQKTLAGLFFDWLTRRRVSMLIQIWDMFSITSIALLVLPLARQRGELFPPHYLSAILAACRSWISRSFFTRVEFSFAWRSFR
jgi:hypothetical protein